MMFSNIYPENPMGLEVLKNKLTQAAAARIPQVLTFGHTKGGNKKLWIERFKELGPIAKDLNVLLVVKQHGGETGTGESCAEITREVNHSNIKVNFDAGVGCAWRCRSGPDACCRDLRYSGSKNRG